MSPEIQSEPQKLILTAVINACTHTCSIFVKIFIDDEYGTYWDDEIGDNDDGQDDNDET